MSFFLGESYPNHSHLFSKSFYFTEGYLIVGLKGQDLQPGSLFPFNNSKGNGPQTQENEACWSRIERHVSTLLLQISFFLAWNIEQAACWSFLSPEFFLRAPSTSHCPSCSFKHLNFFSLWLLLWSTYLKHSSNKWTKSFVWKNFHSLLRKLSSLIFNSKFTNNLQPWTPQIFNLLLFSICFNFWLSFFFNSIFMQDFLEFMPIPYLCQSA